MHVTVKELLATYREKVGRSDLYGAVALSSVVLGASALLARRGTTPFRVCAGLALVGVLLAWVVAWRKQRTLHQERNALRYVLGKKGPLVERASRALELSLAAPTQPGVSAELAALHYHRTLASIDSTLVTNRALDFRRRLIALTSLCGLAITFVTVALPNQVSEGANVFFARAGLAPLAFDWLEYVSLEAKLPAYLGNRTSLVSWESAASLPEGTTLSVRGRPLYEGRQLVLWDGESQVPFVEDGDGQAVAHWVLDQPVELRVAARFGEVLVLDPGSVQVAAAPDRLPEVTLFAEQRDILLEQTSDVEIRFRVVDDHQVSQVDLVLRALGREERRTLDRPAPGNDRVDGGYVLRSDDPFLEKSFVPVIVRIEARDNRPNRSAEEWGKSEAIVLRPREVGAAQAQRLTALQELVDALVDELAKRAEPPDPDKKRALEAERAMAAALAAIHERSVELSSATFSGLAVPRGMVGFLRAQFEKLLQQVGARGASNEAKTRALERMILGLDAALATLSRRDAQEVSKALGDVADEMAFAARAAQANEVQQPEALERLDLASSVIDRGARNLRRLGVLGADLGSVALADLKRVTTARNTKDLLHAELAALHMAARLHRPNPSFGSKGGGSSAGVEGGDGGPQGDQAEAQDGPASDADEQFDRMARDLEELAQEHGQATERSSAALDAAEQGLEDDALRQEAKRRADALRQATALLPQPGEAPSTSRASAALAREHAAAMAHELEDLNFEQAVENGQRAKGAAEEALRRGDLDYITEAAAREALQEVSSQLEWATRQRSEWRARKEQAAREALQEVARLEEELGERARRLAAEGQQAEHGLPTDAVQKLREAQELMRHAANQLGNGEGQQGLNLQRHAQRLLEQAQTGQTKGPDNRRADTPHGGKAAGFGGQVPRDAEGSGAQDFRRRVLDGLARSGGGRLAPAVKRYAEGLLR